MKCPHCDVTLLMSERQGVEIDYCPECRGVWLDRGELDKIIERNLADVEDRSDAQVPMAAPPGPARPRDDRDGDDRDRDRNDRDRDRDDRSRYDDRSRHGDGRYDEKAQKKKKRKSFIEDIFEF